MGDSHQENMKKKLFEETKNASFLRYRVSQFKKNLVFYWYVENAFDEFNEILKNFQGRTQREVVCIFVQKKCITKINFSLFICFLDKSTKHTTIILFYDFFCFRLIL